MKIISMHIYGFGQIEDMKIANLADFQVFYGENEAGKSTIMAFIHGILFGFPTKQQAELRYEPKNNSKYGGKIKVFTDEAGFAVIERVKGKAAAGDVSVTCENGVVGGEDLLRNLLSNIDKSLFQAIFSFNLHGLQNIHQMKGDEIGKFLFSTGTLGTERLAMADSELQKELDARYKPNGKKPLINEKLQLLHQLNQELKTAAGKTQAYETLMKQKDVIQNEIAEVQQTLANIQLEVDKLNEWKKIERIVKEKKWTENEIKEAGEFSFPIRGIERLEKLKPHLSSYEAQILSISERAGHLKNELEVVKPNEVILASESEILAVLERFPLYQQLTVQEKQVEMKLSQYEEKLEDIKERLHLPLNEEEIASINTNIYMKDKVESLSRRGQTLQEVKQQLDRSFMEEKSGLELIEEHIREREAKLVPENERIDLEKQVVEGTNENELEVKLRAVRDKIAFIHNTVKQEKEAEARMKRQKQIQYILFAVIFLGLALYGWLHLQAALLFCGGAGIIIIVALWLINQRGPNKLQHQQTLSDLMQEEQKIVQTFQRPDLKNIAVLQERLEMDNSLREQLKVLHIKLEQQQNQYEKVIKRFEDWELETAEYKEEMRNLCRQLRIPEYMANSFLLEAFQLLEEYKTVTREKKQALESIETLKNDQIEISDKLVFWRNRFLNEKNGGLQQTAYLLKTKLKDEQEKRIQWKEKQGKLADLEADLMQLKQEYQHLQSERNQLLQEANAEDEKEFYELGGKAEKKQKLTERLEDFEKQLHYSLLSELERENYLKMRDCDEIIRGHNEKAESLKSLLTSLQEKQASFKYEIQRIEEGGLYSELLHEFKQKKFELDEEAKKWAVYCLAQNILFQAIERYKSVHLPRMLAAAEKYLSFLTDGNYLKILPHQSGQGFMIERKDMTVFEANELSQATTEQVYVSIRLALATTLYEKYRLPIIIDDSFVNFDTKRTTKVIALLKQLKKHQILFFTCHEHLLKLFQTDELLFLNNGAIQHS